AGRRPPGCSRRPRRSPVSSNDRASPPRRSFPARDLDRHERSFYFEGVSKGAVTRQSILEHAVGIASKVGLSGVTIGKLAEDLDLSKSGLFAHFQSKEALQLQILEFAAERFIAIEVKPALGTPRGEPRVRAMFENWFGW